MSPAIAEEILEVIRSQAIAGLGYQVIPDPGAILPVGPPGLEGTTYLRRRTSAGEHYIQFGYRVFDHQPLHLWVYGQTITPDGPRANADLADIQKLINQSVTNVNSFYQQARAAELATGIIDLSYIEADRCIGILKGLGYQTINFEFSQDPRNAIGNTRIIKPIEEIDVRDLPIIMSLPVAEGTGLVGVGVDQRATGSFKLSLVPSIAAEMQNFTSATPLMQLMVLYDPSEPQVFQELVQRIRETIDVPARQLVIEALILEVSETGLNRLGVSWELTDVPSGSVEALTFGRLPEFNTRLGERATFDLSLIDIGNDWRVQIQALVRTGEAEILSRPSVLTLDHRQASIRIGEDIPIATSIRGATGGDTIQFSFDYIPVGILLNVRPRIAASGEEVTMQIDGIVSSEVPGGDLVVVDQDGNELGRAPRISSRRVQTHTRIANNTPFIIGGLIANEINEEQDKVPLLGDIPWVGAAFRSSATERVKREVIIVITPYVLPTEGVPGRILPDDKDVFDSFDNELFGDVYRIRSDDVPDLAFLNENPELEESRREAERVIRRLPHLADQYPYNQFLEGRVPGEEFLVYHQMYQVIKRREVEKTIPERRIIFLQPRDDRPAGAGIAFLVQYLGEQLGIEVPRVSIGFRWLFNQMQGRALALTYTIPSSYGADEVLDKAVPEVRLVDCPDEDTWRQLLHELNQPDPNGNTRHTILIRDEQDLTRLMRSIVLRYTVELNSGAAEAKPRLRDFNRGRQLIMPTISEEEIFLVDHEVARYFYLSVDYFAALLDTIRKDSEALRQDVEAVESGIIMGGSR
ncbi:type II secretion system protein GspD [Mucisphaera sp.]|uniref:type II secretion system protein GspD n=1 Tax=Mucisphaera sp. TaxID=2913024 RepID=UPI003D144055